jgi:hypothetical protein
LPKKDLKRPTTTYFASSSAPSASSRLAPPIALPGRTTPRVSLTNLLYSDAAKDPKSLILNFSARVLIGEQLLAGSRGRNVRNGQEKGWEGNKDFTIQENSLLASNWPLFDIFCFEIWEMKLL